MDDVSSVPPVCRARELPITRDSYPLSALLPSLSVFHRSRLLVTQCAVRTVLSICGICLSPLSFRSLLSVCSASSPMPRRMLLPSRLLVSDTFLFVNPLKNITRYLQYLKYVTEYLQSSSVDPNWFPKFTLSLHNLHSFNLMVTDHQLFR